MGWAARRNPRARAAARGVLKPKAKPSTIVAAITALAALFMPSGEVTPRQFRQRVVTRSRAQIARAAHWSRWRRAERERHAKLSRMTHLYPPKSGKRRPEFSSSVPGQWSAKPAA
jgi:hypothetical protein